MGEHIMYVCLFSYLFVTPGEEHGSVSQQNQQTRGGQTKEILGPILERP